MEVDPKQELSRDLINERPPQESQELEPQPESKLKSEHRPQKNSSYVSSLLLSIWFNKYFKFQIILKNENSVARDHMANERTLLSYIRTSLTFLIFGIGFLQFYTIESKLSSISSSIVVNIDYYLKPIGLIFFILSLITLLFGIFRFLQIQFYLINNNYYPVTRLIIIFLIIGNLSMVILLIILNIKISIL